MPPITFSPAKSRAFSRLLALAIIVLAAVPLTHAQTCARTIYAYVVAIDQPFFYNRIGAANPAGMIYALEGDVVAKNAAAAVGPGNAQLRTDKRPRPLVLRMNVDDCLQINFKNWLAAARPHPDQPATRTASAHVIGLSLVNSITSGGVNVGANPGGALVAPGGSATYTYYGGREGAHLLASGAAQSGGEGDLGSLSPGLFGAVIVEPKNSEWYRSQITQQDLALVTVETLASGHPKINYNATYPSGKPVLKMLDPANRIVHSDINAIITGPNAGKFPVGQMRANSVYPNRDQPFREFTVIFHDEITAVQAYPAFTDPVLGHTLAGVRDGFGINYGVGGAGAMVLANRLKQGAAKDCAECKYEEFFLTSWVGGDPAMLVDNPTNTGLAPTRVLYPDDPSNVHHSYLNDHVRFRNIHAGREHHIFHLHAHQWLHTPDSDGSTYLDSQAIGPGSAFTYEIAYNGSGNRNRTPGDSIFHCHFYPHFAQGMWELWRVHDVFEDGSPSRNLPDAELPLGTPTPAVVPMPTLAMAPLPTPTMKGYPFYVPGVAGHRPPTPPLDIAPHTDGQLIDGGLPRHVGIESGTALNHHNIPSPVFNDQGQARLDMDKKLTAFQARELPEEGTQTEKDAMTYHAMRNHASVTPSGTAATFVTSGNVGKRGSPFADPCANDAGQPIGNPRTYKAVGFQLDLAINKKGWHMPQGRMLSLWGDYAATRNGTRKPEPLFFRANTGDCVEFHHANLLPNAYAQDDFQVRTPTDVLGQHIHLVKFDVMASDGSGNGFNYEDGTLGPEEVIERIEALKAPGGRWDGLGGVSAALLNPKPHPVLGVLGARSTVQRWYVDDVLNNTGVARGLRSVYTHDHYGPSTHQQTGLYAALVIEPNGSSWLDSSTGTPFGNRYDGGPTSWRADIITAPNANSYREFLLMMADFALAQRPEAGPVPVPGAVGAPVNPPVKDEVPVTAGNNILLEPAQVCPGGAPLPCPESIALSDVGTMTVNYQNEPIPLRVRDPQTGQQAAGLAGDLSHVFRSDIQRADAAMSGDPATPILNVYENDRVQLRMLGGAQEELHNFSMHGPIWRFEVSDANSGWRSSQTMGISEHYEIVLPPLLPRGNPEGTYADNLYKIGASTDDLWNGLWGFMRQHKGLRADLRPLPNNPSGKAPVVPNPTAWNGICPATAPLRSYAVSAITANVVYNSRSSIEGGTLSDPKALLYVRDSDLDLTNPANPALKPGAPVEPMVLRAAAGECVQVTLTNRIPSDYDDQDGYGTLPMIVEGFNANQVSPSKYVGLHAQLLAYDGHSDGANVGRNPVTLNAAEVAAPGSSVTYKWYAGTVAISSTGVRTATPVEFGAVNLTASDPIKHPQKGLGAALIVEPRGATWVDDYDNPAIAANDPNYRKSRAAATVTVGTSKFREFVLVFQNFLNLTHSDGTPVEHLAAMEDAEDSGVRGFNYRTEPFWHRMGFDLETPLDLTKDLDYTNTLTNAQVGGDPQTPVFSARAGETVRFRVLHPGGNQRNNVFGITGHQWEELPYTFGSTTIGVNPVSEWKGVQGGHGPTNHFDVVVKYGAGGKFKVTGDYLFRDYVSSHLAGGQWGIFRVLP